MFAFDGNAANSGSQASVAASSSGSISYVAGKNGQAVRIPKGAFFTLTNENGQYPKHDFTIALWVKMKSYQSNTENAPLADINFAGSGNPAYNGGILMAIHSGGIRCVMNAAPKGGDKYRISS